MASLRYLDIPVSDRNTIKDKAYKMSPEIWESYSGKSKDEKRKLDYLRSKCLDEAASYYTLDEDGYLLELLEY